ncbi:hypothetical protein CAEBREN_04971 [Caenorhabditis brenneri]|uniref:Uncharacterized protein n=1 Tax=Caenorhabditis brenneri TaxID=135651 RepID=G0MQ96_CAEBE|nr:hypothetical protein CAEBREN_04971 [Caenorhabditis brenneri]
MKLEDRIELPREEQDIQNSSSSYPHCESFDHIVTMESTYDFHRQLEFDNLKRHRDEYDNVSEKILKLRKQLTDFNLDPKKRKWLEDDLDGLVRKQESALCRIKMAEKLTRRDMRNDPPPAYQPDDPLKDLRKRLGESEKKVPLDEKKGDMKFE